MCLCIVNVGGRATLCLCVGDSALLVVDAFTSFSFFAAVGEKCDNVAVFLLSLAVSAGLHWCDGLVLENDAETICPPKIKVQSAG